MSPSSSTSLKVSMKFSAGHDECLLATRNKRIKGKEKILVKRENGFHKRDERMVPSNYRTLKVWNEISAGCA